MATTTRAGARERLSFATIEEVLPLPDLLAVQKNAFEWFMKEGLAETLREISPIEDYSGNLILEFVDHEFEEPKHSIEECRERDMVFGCPLFVTARFGNRETGEIKEQRVFMGEFPVMTPGGTFIINGTEKVVVSQLVRSPGVYFDVATDKTSEKLLFGAKVIPARGAWLEFDTDKRNTIGVRIDRKRRQMVTTLLRALDFGEVDLTTDEAILDYFGGADIIRTTLDRDHTTTREDALIDIHRKLRPGEPPSPESARGLIEQLFFSTKRYDLSRVGRYKADQKLGHDVPGNVHVLTPYDILATIKYIVALHEGGEGCETDDIDHFGNRRVRAVGELIQNQVRIGLTRMERVVRERMTTQDVEAITPTTLINIRPLTAAIKEFFGTSQLCQLYDQTNSLTGLTHKRRLSALGPGGLSRERAGFEVRDVHTSHYGRMCPIETPEGPNIGLIGSLATYARINPYGFIETPYRRVVDGRVTGEIDYLDAHSEDRYIVAQANTPVDESGAIPAERVLVRHKGEIEYVSPPQVDYMDVSPKQIVSVSSAMIPFLEHDDANRALMGSNMQRQAVPLLRPEAPYIGTGIESRAAVDSGDMVLAEEDGTVVEVAGDRVVVESDKTKQRRTYRLMKFQRSNQSTSFNQKVLVEAGDKVRPGDTIADGPCTDCGEMALGKNLLIAFMTWEGHTFEDAIVLSERLVRDDVLTSIHIEEYEVEARDTKLGEEEITRDIPNVSEDVLRDLDERGIIRIGAEVGPGDYLVGKVTPKGETELTPEERLLRAIFGEKAREVRDTSLKTPHGEWGKVIDVRVYSREDNADLNPGVNKLVRVFVAQKRKISVGDKLAGRHGNKGVIAKILPVEDMPFLSDGTPVDVLLSPLGVPTRMNVGQVLETLLGWAANTGWEGGPDQLPPDRQRKIRPVGRPSRFIASPVFEGAHWSDEEAQEAGADPTTGKVHASIQNLLRRSRVSPWRAVDQIGEDGKTQLFDGRTGEPYDHPIAVGYMYILKLLHLVDDKIHARSTGPYSMITQQPLGGKAQFGGQRFGEMEVWALEAYGAAHCLQELLTIKSDDVLGRVKVYEAIVKGENIPEPGLPESFKVLVKEMQSLCLNVEVLSREGNEIEMASYEEDAFRTAEELGIDISRPERASEAEG